jgi:uncharacterized cupin superfamily protein
VLDKEGAAMNDKSRSLAINANEVNPRVNSNYPPFLAQRLVGREKRQLGDLFGVINFGVNQTTLLPGACSALRHYHSKQDEFIYILQGQPTLITDFGAEVLTPGMCAGFKAGVTNGHHLINLTQENVIYLEVGDRTQGDTGAYPDDDLKAVMIEGKWHFTHKDGSPY